MFNTQVKGYSQSSLGSKHPQVPHGHSMMYERVWDEADYVVPPAENGAFFVTTNVVITPNQTMGHCPEVKIQDESICICDKVFFCTFSYSTTNQFGHSFRTKVLLLQDPGEVPESICEEEESANCMANKHLIKSKNYFSIILL